MKALSLFSGIGGIDLACEWAGIETVAFCEREPFPQKVLRKHWPNVPIYDDVCTLTKERLDADGIGAIDLIHGGYPCQPFSHAGKREGTEDDRHLWPEYFRLVKELRPRWVVGENVAGHISLGLDIVLSDLESEGYSTRAFIIPAAAVNAPHRRDRVFIIAYSMRSIRSSQQEGEHKKMGRTQNPLDDGKEQFMAQILANTDGERELQQERIFSESGGWLSNSSEDVSNATSTGLPQRGRSEQSESYTKKGTGLEPKFERCGEDVADTDSERMERSADSGSLGSGWQERYEHIVRRGEGAGNWTVEPDVGRVANGIPQRVDRLKALGNAVVPQQIYPILLAIKEIDEAVHGS